MPRPGFDEADEDDGDDDGAYDIDDLSSQTSATSGDSPASTATTANHLGDAADADRFRSQPPAPPKISRRHSVEPPKPRARFETPQASTSGSSSARRGTARGEEGDRDDLREPMHNRLVQGRTRHRSHNNGRGADRRSPQSPGSPDPAHAAARSRSGLSPALASFAHHRHGINFGPNVAQPRANAFAVVGEDTSSASEAE